MDENKAKEKLLSHSYENEMLNKAIMELNSSENGKVTIGEIQYTKVSARVEAIRRHFGFNIRILTEVSHMDNDFVLLKAVISILKDGEWNVVATGHAEETRTSSEINRFSAIENAETSAIGRALAALGISGSEYASSDELLTVLSKKMSVEKEGLNNEQLNPEKKSNVSPASPSQITYIKKLINDAKADEGRFLENYNIKEIEELSKVQAKEAITLLSKKIKLSKSLNVNNQESTKTLEVLKENQEHSVNKNDQSIKYTSVTKQGSEKKEYKSEEIHTKMKEGEKNEDTKTKAEKENNEKEKTVSTVDNSVEETKNGSPDIEEDKASVNETSVEEKDLEEDKASVNETSVEEKDLEEDKASADETSVEEKDVEEDKASLNEKLVEEKEEKEEQPKTSKSTKKASEKKNATKKTAVKKEATREKVGNDLDDEEVITL